MDFKIKIKCHKCSCDFELRPESINCTEITCPNCTSKVNPEYATHILNGIKELGLVPEYYSDDGETFFPKTGFSFEVQHYSILDFPKQYGTFFKASNVISKTCFTWLYDNPLLITRFPISLEISTNF